MRQGNTVVRGGLFVVLVAQLAGGQLTGHVAAQSATVGPILPSADARVGPILPSASATLRPTAVADAAVQTSAAVGIQRVNVASDGAQANAYSESPALSANGQFVAYASDATNLVANDTNGHRDIFVYDRSTRITTRESVSSAGAQADGDCYFPSISGDGRFVAFSCRQTSTLVPGASGAQVYVRDRLLGVTTLASVSTSGIPGNSTATEFSRFSNSTSISADGRFVSFTSEATNLVAGDTDGLPDVFTRDRASGTTSVESVLAFSGGVSLFGQASALSSDGRYLVFIGRPFGATNFRSQFLRAYVRDRVLGQAVFESNVVDRAPDLQPAISGDGRLVAVPFGAALHLIDWRTDLVFGNGLEVDRPTAGVGGAPQLSADGRYLSYIRKRVASSRSELSVYDTSTSLFTVVAVASETTQVAAGVIAFASEDLLVPGDTNGTHDIFMAPVGQAPLRPTNLAVARNGETVTLTWRAAQSGPAPTDYVIEAGTGPDQIDVTTFSTGSTATSFSATVTGTPAYFVRVRATNACGLSMSSNEVTLPASPGALLGVPIGLVGLAAGSTVTLAWQAPTSGTVTSYTIEAGSASGLTDLANFNTGSFALTYTATGVPAGTYFVRVRAASGGGLSPPSNEVVVIVTSPCPLPAVPTGLTRSVSGSTVTLAWTAAAGATSYVLEAGTAPGSANLATSDLGSAATTFTASGVAPGTYFVRVRSKNACGTSGPSNEASVIVP